MSNLIQLSPHNNMSPEECLSICLREVDDLEDVIVVGYDTKGDLVVRSSVMTRAEATFMLMKAVDHARGI